MATMFLCHLISKYLETDSRLIENSGNSELLTREFITQKSIRVLKFPNGSSSIRHSKSVTEPHFKRYCYLEDLGL